MLIPEGLKERIHFVACIESLKFFDMKKFTKGLSNPGRRKAFNKPPFSSTERDKMNSREALLPLEDDHWKKKDIPLSNSKSDDPKKMFGSLNVSNRYMSNQDPW